MALADTVAVVFRLHLQNPSASLPAEFQKVKIRTSFDRSRRDNPLFRLFDSDFYILDRLRCRTPRVFAGDIIFHFFRRLESDPLHLHNLHMEFVSVIAGHGCEVRSPSKIEHLEGISEAVKGL